MENFKFDKGVFMWGMIGLGTGAVVSVLTKGNPTAFVNCGLGFTLFLAVMTLQPKNPKD